MLFHVYSVNNRMNFSTSALGMFILNLSPSLSIISIGRPVMMETPHFKQGWGLLVGLACSGLSSE